MNAKLKGLLVASVLILGVLSSLWWIGRSVSQVSVVVEKNSLALEARRLLFQMQNRFRENYETHGSFAGPIGDCPMITARFGAGFMGGDGQKVWWGEERFLSELEKYCSDCAVSAGKFKIVAIGNVDQDSELDVWILNSEQVEPTHIQVD